MMVIRGSQAEQDGTPDKAVARDPFSRGRPRFADQVAADRVPSVRAIRAQLHLSQPVRSGCGTTSLREQGARKASFMRKQYYLWPAGTGFDAWGVGQLVSLSRELPVHALPVDSVGEGGSGAESGLVRYSAESVGAQPSVPETSLTTQSHSTRHSALRGASRVIGFGLAFWLTSRSRPPAFL
jgi:hypothetical protein